MYTLDVLFYFFTPIISIHQLKQGNEENGKKGELTNCTALVLGRKDINSSFKSINEDIHLLFCIVEVKTCAGTCIDTKGPMQNLSTMMPWPNCYAMLKPGVSKSINSADEDSLDLLKEVHLMEVQNVQ